MPIYEYRCDDCGRVSEALQRLSEPPLTECGECGGRLRKQVSAPAFQFKGSGWYVTDYARKSGGGDGDKGDKGDKGGESGGKGDKGGESGGEGGGGTKETAKKETAGSSSAKGSGDGE